MKKWSMVYEKIIRRSFQCGRSEDPAGLADNDVFELENLWRIKAGLLCACVQLQCNYPEFKDRISKIMERISEVMSKSDLIGQMSDIEKIEDNIGLHVE